MCGTALAGPGLAGPGKAVDLFDYGWVDHTAMSGRSGGGDEGEMRHAHLEDGRTAAEPHAMEKGSTRPLSDFRLEFYNAAAFYEGGDDA